ncbi:hypothetical protein SMG44B_10790 [Stenotrophomonas maltophilia]
MTRVTKGDSLNGLRDVMAGRPDSAARHFRTNLMGHPGGDR